MRKKLIVGGLVLISIFAWYFYYINTNTTCARKDDAVCKIDVNGEELNLTVAYSPKKQEKGLMFVEKLPKNTGMIFVYDNEQFMTFWMKNTLIPLSIAFVKANGKIVNIYDMYPEPYASDYSLTRYASSEKVMYAIEVPLHWFREHNIKVGDTLNIPI